MNAILLIIFPFIWLVILLTIYALFREKQKNINVKLLVLYVLFMGMLGPVGEVFVGTLYNLAFGQPLWQYKVLPTHHAYTSLYAPVIWGVSGAYLYYIHEHIRLFKQKSKWLQATIRMFETIFFEATLNVSFWILTGSLIFYYLPADLWHVTSIQTLPFYFILSLIVMKSMKRLRKDPVYYSALFGLLTLVVVYLAN
jgi:hypothetical protein